MDPVAKTKLLFYFNRQRQMTHDTMGQRLRKKLSLQNLGPKLSLKTTDVTPIKEILNSEF